VLGLLHAYACISTGVRFNVKNTVAKTKNVAVFATKANPTTKENIANIYGAKTLLALIPLDLDLEFEHSAIGKRRDQEVSKIHVHGHISRPVFGEGRQTPDRQLFFVNSRPCGLPQISKAFNEVYKSFNVTQSPFIFADFQMDTNAYDVNVSPDKRTVLLHNSGPLIESLKLSLNQLFEDSDQTVPVAQVTGAKRTTKRHSQMESQDKVSAEEPESSEELESSEGRDDESTEERGQDCGSSAIPSSLNNQQEHWDESGQLLLSDGHLLDQTNLEPSIIDTSIGPKALKGPPTATSDVIDQKMPDNEVRSVGARIGERQIPLLDDNNSQTTPNIIQNAFDRMRPKRPAAEVATVTIGSKTTTSVVGSTRSNKRDLASTGFGSRTSRRRRIHTPSQPNIFGRNLKTFAAPGTQIDGGSSTETEDITDMDDDDDDESASESAVSPSSKSLSDSRDRPLQDDQHLPNMEDKFGGDSREEAAEISHQPDEEYLDDSKKKTQDEAKVQELIRKAEEKATLLSENNINRANTLSKGYAQRYSTTNLVSKVDGSTAIIEARMKALQKNMQSYTNPAGNQDEGEMSPEERLSLTVTKDDFAKMRVVGQFNLGFILATRSPEPGSQACTRSKDELFIIDQHASDEKFNFERLQAETVVQTQRLVRPATLDFTAVEEEIIIENQLALEKNGFVVDVDDSGNEPIGRRCKLVSIPLSKEVVFDVHDLEELIVLLSESPAMNTAKSSAGSDICRPSKVRKMFAMRACRSSIMIGKALTLKQMEKVIHHMGTIDKPWNCPHGRPTMRHLMSLSQWNEYDEHFREEERSYSDLESSEDDLANWKRFFEWQREEESERDSLDDK
jgi:DNA mismatch repair protein PMS2